MLIEEVWHSYDKDNVWLSFDALKVTHRVTEVLCGNRCSITLFTPGKLERLTPSDWDTLDTFGFPVYLYDVSSLQMRRLPDDLHSKPLIPKPTAEDIKALEARAHEVARFTLYVKGKCVKPPELKHPDIHSLVQIAATENGRSEVSCVIDQDDQGT